MLGRRVSTLLLVTAIVAACSVTAAIMLLSGGAASRSARPTPDATPPALVGHGAPAPPGSSTEDSVGPERDPSPPALSDVTGALLVHQDDGSWKQRCSGAVVDSTSGDVVVTAAHCLYAGGVLGFAPAYDGGTPYGVWPVTSTHTDPAWQDHADQNDDFAFLAVATPAGRTGTVEAAVGGLELGMSPLVGQQVTVRGYPYATNGHALTCHAEVTSTAGFPTVDCEHFAAGVSGGPLVQDGDEVVGVIGGLETGGCTDDISYASPFTARARLVLVAAEQQAPSSPPTQTAPHEDC